MLAFHVFCLISGCLPALAYLALAVLSCMAIIACIASPLSHISPLLSLSSIYFQAIQLAAHNTDGLVRPIISRQVSLLFLLV
ncbi:hypothetical protein BDW72DRAFT_177500, partial [Aspergillus terricola var. indicus]